MENQSYITILLILIIGLVILIDYILKIRKKTQDKSVKRFIEKEKFGKKRWFNLKTFFWTYPIPAIVYILIPYFLEFGMNFGEYLDFLSEPGSWGWNYYWVLIFIPLAIHIVWFIYSLNWNLYLHWILKRKKNISISVLIIVILKITIHYFFFSNDACQRLYADVEYRNGFTREESKIGCAEFKDYVNAVLFDVSIYPFENSPGAFRWKSFVLNARLELFIPIILIYILIVWFFNDKIKAK